jgi:hypothetical protein
MDTKWETCILFQKVKLEGKGIFSIIKDAQEES